MYISYEGGQTWVGFQEEVMTEMNFEAWIEVSEVKDSLGERQ